MCSRCRFGSRRSPMLPLDYRSLHRSRFRYITMPRRREFFCNLEIMASSTPPMRIHGHPVIRRKSA